MLGNGGDWSKASVVPGRPRPPPLLPDCGSVPTPASAHAAQPEPQLRFVYTPSSHGDSHESHAPSATSSMASNDRGPWFELPSVADAFDAEADLMMQRSDSSPSQGNVPLRPAPGRNLRASEGVYNGTQGCPDWNELFPDRPPPQGRHLPLLTTSAFSQSQPPLQPMSRDEASAVPIPRPPPIHRPPSIQQQRGNRLPPTSRPVTTQAQPPTSSQHRPTRPPPLPPHARVMRNPGARASPSTTQTPPTLSEPTPVNRTEQPRPRPPPSNLPAQGNPSANPTAALKETLEKATGVLETRKEETGKNKEEAKEESEAAKVQAREIRRDWGECIICFEKARLDLALLPCGHVIACEPCLRRVWNNGQGRGSNKPKCPACNADILKPPHKLYFG